MNKSLCILIAIAICPFLTSCNIASKSDETIPDPHSGSIKSYDYERDQTEKILSELIKYFDEKDKEGIKALFAKQVAQDYDLDAQIDKVFEIYNGKYVSFEIDSGGEKSKHVIDGKYVYLRHDGELKNIQTDNNKIFEISIVRCVVNDDNPDNIGLNKIYLSHTDGSHIAPIGETSQTEIYTYKY